jgi:hypothetical protein
LVISVASNLLAHIRAIRNIFILLAEKFKKISHVERNKLDLKEIRCEVYLFLFASQCSLVAVYTTIVFISHLLTLTCALRPTKRLIFLINNSVVTWNILTILGSLSDTDIAFMGFML